MQSANQHTYVATRLLRDETKYREARRAGVLPANSTNTGRSDRTGQGTQLTTTHTSILKYSRIRYTNGNTHILHDTRESNRPLAHGYLVVARLCFTPHIAVHRHEHTACVRPNGIS